MLNVESLSQGIGSRMLFTAKRRAFSHQPLVYWKSQIRLLRVEPDLYGPIRCSVEIFDLAKAPAYAALSYTWGPEFPTYDIWIDDKVLSVRQNLYQFLKCRRRERKKHFRFEKDLYIFIDQICIDQSDPEERNRQVQLMSQIYSKCWQVIVWLNDEQGQCARAAQAFGHPAKRTVSLAKLLCNDYFTRLWIVQELLLAPSICVFTPGNTWLSWPTFVEITREVVTGAPLSAEEAAAWCSVPVNTSRLVLMTSKFARDRQINPHGLEAPHQLSWYRFAAKAKTRTSSKELLEILSFSANICQEPRDKVYGIMNLLRVERQLTVDYYKPVYDVFREAIIELHSVVDFEGDQSYDQWLKTVQRLGHDMGIDDNDTAELLALLEFVNLILPPQCLLDKEGDNSLPTLVSMIRVEISDTRQLRVDVASHRSFQHKYGLTAHCVVSDNKVTIDHNRGISHSSQRNSVRANFMGLPPGLHQGGRCVESSNKTSHNPKAGFTRTFEFNVISEISKYWEQGDNQESTTKENRWNAFVKSIIDTASLKGLSLSWYCRHNGMTIKYKTTPRWDHIFQIPLSRMAQIIKEYEAERVCDELSRQQAQVPSTRPTPAQDGSIASQSPIKPKSRPMPHKRAARVVRYLAYGWVGLVGCILAAVLVLWSITDRISRVKPLLLGLVGFYVFAGRRKA